MNERMSVIVGVPCAVDFFAVIEVPAALVAAGAMQMAGPLHVGLSI
jgi:hypothetical protein